MKHIKSYDEFLLESDSAKAIEDRVNKIGEVKDKADDVKKDLEDKTGDLSKAEVKAAKGGDGGDDDKSKEMDSVKKHLSSDEPTEPARQGYDDREDESIGARLGKEADKKEDYKDRREDSYGKWGKRGEEDRDGEHIDRAHESESTDTNSAESIDEMQEEHDKYDSRLTSMTIGKVLDFLKQKDPDAYKDIEKYLEINFKDLTPQEEGNFFTGMTS
jgi:hypothetical protein